ncbi:hypothetical protein [Salinibacter virus M31CR41-3]|nr:hypothetical protein [Salinibacter virus M31CR41-3]
MVIYKTEATRFKMLRLHRTDYLPRGTRGVLFLPSGTSLYTIELPWRDNSSGTFDEGGSCIPEGRYDLVENYYYGGGYNSVEIGPVPKRDEIQVHIGNTAMDVEGCVVVGLREGSFVPDGKQQEFPAVLNSTEAFQNTFWPEVRNLLPTEIVVTSGSKADPAALETFSL